MFAGGRQDSRTFFDMKALAPRPLSEVTDIYETDFEEESDVEIDSPRLSLNSVRWSSCGQPAHPPLTVDRAVWEEK